jgi:Tfp pilus assembly protein PilZ
MRIKNEARRYSRYIVDDMNILAKSFMNTCVELADISKTGACVTAYERLQLEGRNFLKLSSVPGLLLECHIVWRNPNTAFNNVRRMVVPSFKTGLRFKDLSQDRSIMLEDYLGLFQTPDIERASSAFKPRAPRFKIESSEEALLYYLRVSMVQKISLGGMLIKTNSAFLPGKTMTLALFLSREELPSELQGKVASIIPASTDGELFFHIGIEFINMRERDQARLNRFIQYHEFV